MSSTNPTEETVHMARTPSKLVNVYEFVLADGTSVGCGTELELTYWSGQGTMEGHQLGRVLTQEPASEDERRKAVWGIA